MKNLFDVVVVTGAVAVAAVVVVGAVAAIV
jgi:hypothetical protein